MLVQEQVVHVGEPYLPTYSVVTSNTSVATSAAHALQIMAGSSKHVRINRITFTQYGLAVSATSIELDIMRLTSAGSGGTSITPRPYDAGDSAAGATAQTLPSSKGTEGVQLGFMRMPILTAVPLLATFVWEAPARGKPIIIPAGTSNGIALKVVTGIATSTSVSIWVEFTETDWL